MGIDVIVADTAEEVAVYSEKALEKRDKTITIPLVSALKDENDTVEKTLWENLIEAQEQLKEFHKIRDEMKKERPET